MHTSTYCYLCDSEAVERCYTCGKLFCEKHGKINCVRCETGIAPGDTRADRISATPVSNAARPGWWRPQPAEDYDPPACHLCEGLARYVCANCGKRYCREHAGKAGLCEPCQRSQRGGNIFLAIVMLIIAALTVAAFAFGAG